MLPAHDGPNPWLKQSDRHWYLQVIKAATIVTPKSPLIQVNATQFITFGQSNPNLWAVGMDEKQRALVKNLLKTNVKTSLLMYLVAKPLDWMVQ